MKSTAKIGLTMAAVMVMATTSGCGGGGLNSASAAPVAGPSMKNAASAAAKADKLLAKGDLVKALGFAEAAVEAAPADADMRVRLGQVYLANGRFLSAERSFMDAMDLGGATARNVISLALARIALGKVDSARTLLDNYRADLPASDYGLAMAMAGDTARAVEVLTVAMRQTDATARTRQNLALAYALDGNWRASQVMALQDLPEDAVNARIAQWARIARPGAYQDRVAAVLNVTPQDDPGQPSRLALSGSINPMASVAPVAEMPPLDAALAALGPAPVAGARSQFQPVPVGVQSAELPTSVAAQAQTPLIREPAESLKQASKAPEKTPAPVKMASNGDNVPVAVLPPREQEAPRTGLSGSHLVQLGAFSSPENARAAWKKLVARHPALRSFSNASSTVTVKGRTLYRLAAVGFGNKASADSFCSGLRQDRGACIVRSINGAPIARGDSRLAAR